MDFNKIRKDFLEILKIKYKKSIGYCGNRKVLDLMTAERGCHTNQFFV